MELKEAKEILKEHNEWRRGAEIKQQEPKLIGEAIDTVLAHLKEQESGVLTSAPSRDKNFNYTKCYELALSKLDNLSDIELAYFITDWQNPQVKTT